MNKNTNIKWHTSFALGMLLGAVIFIGIYGISVLDVTNDDWLYRYEFDLTQHYLGWRMYRNSGWHFPLGLCDTSIYPYFSSIVYTDSIPLLAMFFKFLSPILPDKFQYFGLYGILCFMLQGGMAKLLLRKYVKNEFVGSIGAVFFISNIVFVQRMFWQTALSSHFLILMAILLFLYRDNFKSLRKRIILWCGLGILTISIHFYLYGMISVMLAAFALLDALTIESKPEKNDKTPNRVINGIKVFLLYICSYLAMTIVTFYVFGGFYGTIKTVDDSTALYNAGLNSLFMPMGKSLFFSNGEFGDMELEGFGYIGLAIGILLIPAIIGFISDFKRMWAEKKGFLIISILLIVFFYVFSLSPIITICGKYLFSINIIPGFITKISWGLFRACGRFIWPVMYVVMLIAIIFSEKILKKSYPYILVAMMLLQVVEYSGYFKNTYMAFETFEYLPCPADSLAQYDLSRYKHIQFMENYDWFDYYSSLECYYDFVGYSRLASDKKMTISNFHFSRDYDKVVQEQIDKCYEKLNSGNPEVDTLYVFSKSSYIEHGYQGKFKNVMEYDTGYDIVLVPQ